MGLRFNPFLLELAGTIPGRGQVRSATLSHWRFWEVCSSPESPRLEDGELVRKKVVQVHLENYIKVGSVISLIHYFYVKKGLVDVRMVYNGTECGLNKSVWAPHFGLPMVQQTLHSLLPGYSQCDLDIGEMFLNFL